MRAVHRHAMPHAGVPSGRTHARPDAHRSRRRGAQGETWLRRFRRAILFTDEPAPSAAAALRTPVISHSFAPAATERIYEGGNWCEIRRDPRRDARKHALARSRRRALPIVRALAELFFTQKAVATQVRRGELPPKWAFIVDDDAFVFDSQVLDSAWYLVRFVICTR